MSEELIATFNQSLRKRGVILPAAFKAFVEQLLLYKDENDITWVHRKTARNNGYVPVSDTTMWRYIKYLIEMNAIKVYQESNNNFSPRYKIDVEKTLSITREGLNNATNKFKTRERGVACKSMEINPDRLGKSILKREDKENQLKEKNGSEKNRPNNDEMLKAIQELFERVRKLEERVFEEGQEENKSLDCKNEVISLSNKVGDVYLDCKNNAISTDNEGENRPLDCKSEVISTDNEGENQTLEGAGEPVFSRNEGENGLSEVVCKSKISSCENNCNPVSHNLENKIDFKSQSELINKKINKYSSDSALQNQKIGGEDFKNNLQDNQIGDTFSNSLFSLAEKKLTDSNRASSLVGQNSSPIGQNSSLAGEIHSLAGEFHSLAGEIHSLAGGVPSFAGDSPSPAGRAAAQPPLPSGDGLRISATLHNVGENKYVPCDEDGFPTEVKGSVSCVSPSVTRKKRPGIFETQHKDVMELISFLRFNCPGVLESIYPGSLEQDDATVHARIAARAKDFAYGDMYQLTGERPDFKNVSTIKFVVAQYSDNEIRLILKWLDKQSWIKGGKGIYAIRSFGGRAVKARYNYMFNNGITPKDDYEEAMMMFFVQDYKEKKEQLERMKNPALMAKYLKEKEEEFKKSKEGIELLNKELKNEELRAIVEKKRIEEERKLREEREAREKEEDEFLASFRERFKTGNFTKEESSRATAIIMTRKASARASERERLLTARAMEKKYVASKKWSSGEPIKMDQLLGDE